MLKLALIFFGVLALAAGNIILGVILIVLGLTIKVTYTS